MIKEKKSILMGVIGAAHGIKGEVRIKSFSDDPFALIRYAPIYDALGRHFTILNLRLHKTRLIAQIEGIKTREEAQALRDTELFVDRQSFDDDLEEDEFYQTDLLGFAAFALEEDGQEAKQIGHVSAFFNFGAGDLVEISNDAGVSWLVPFTHEAVPVIDRQKKSLHINRQAAGLVEGNRRD